MTVLRLVLSLQQALVQAVFGCSRQLKKSHDVITPIHAAQTTLSGVILEDDMADSEMNKSRSRQSTTADF